LEQAAETTDIGSVLLQVIDRNPGIRYRELLRMTGLVNGVLTYHLTALEKSDRIRADRESRMTRFYPPSVSEKESAVLKFVRHEPIRDILLFVFENENCTFSEIVEHSQKAPSTISSHLKRLKDDGVIAVRYGEFQLYRVSDRELVADVLSKFRPGFVDKVVDGFADAVEEL
jgi:predicted transcriptional regulator